MGKLTGVLVVCAIALGGCKAAEQGGDENNEAIRQDMVNRGMKPPSTPAPQKPVEFIVEGDPVLAEQAIALFKAECPRWFDGHRKDIQDIRVDIDSDHGASFKRRKFGWEKEAWIRVQLRDDRALETFRTDQRHFRGHTFHYWIGAGDEPGMFGGGKEGGRAPCNLKTTHPKMSADSYKFRSIPAAAFLK